MVNMFLQFLDDYNIKTQYLKAFDITFVSHRTFVQFMSTNEPSLFIWQAFPWVSTGGYLYWESIDDEWNKQVGMYNLLQPSA